MTTRLRLDISQRAVALRSALIQLDRWGLSMHLNSATSGYDASARFDQYRRAACAMLGIPENQANMSLDSVTDLAQIIAANVTSNQARLEQRSRLRDSSRHAPSPHPVAN
jgi:hypothetical protein